MFSTPNYADMYASIPVCWM